MALMPTTTEPIRSSEMFGWVITMQSSAKDVRVSVSDKELLTLYLFSTRDHVLKLPEEPRSRIGAIASRKYPAGRIETDGSVRITFCRYRG
jgi:hypothetical protein